MRGLTLGFGVFLAGLFIGCGTTDPVPVAPIDGNQSSTNTITNTPPLIPPAKTPLEVQAEAGDPVAQFNLAVKLEDDGHLAEAVPWYQKAATQGLPEAQYNVGYMYARGEGLPQSATNAAQWFQLAASNNLAVAQHMMGYLYEEGQGVVADPAKALGWYTKAADQGHVDAQYYLGFLFASGRGVEADLAKAAGWFLKAAQNGKADAQFQIGVYLARGTGLPQDVVEGYKWLSLAGLNNHQGAKRARNELMGQMAPDAVTEGQKRVGDFLSSKRETPAP